MSEASARGEVSGATSLIITRVKFTLFRKSRSPYRPTVRFRILPSTTSSSFVLRNNPTILCSHLNREYCARKYSQKLVDFEKVIINYVYVKYLISRRISRKEALTAVSELNNRRFKKRTERVMHQVFVAHIVRTARRWLE